MVILEARYPGNSSNAALPRRRKDGGGGLQKSALKLSRVPNVGLSLESQMVRRDRGDLGLWGLVVGELQSLTSIRSASATPQPGTAGPDFIE